MKKLIITLIILLGLGINSYGDIIRTVSHAACRVSAGNAKGSGTAVYQSENYIYVLTNAHVTGRNRNVKLEFWKYGRKVPKPIPGIVIWTNEQRQNIDFSIVQIDKSNISSIPSIIPFAPEGYTLNKGDYVLTVGCPNGGWLSVKEGQVLKSTKSTYYFYPVAFDGQSGSGLFTIVDGEPRITGVVTARSSRNISYNMNGFSNQCGIAYNIDNLRANLNQNSIHKTRLWALDDKGKHWPQTNNGGVVAPGDVNIIKKNIEGTGLFGNGCGPNGCPPNYRQQRPQPPMTPLPQPQLPQQKPQPKQPNNNDGYGKIPPGFGDPINKSTKKQLEELQKKYEELKAEHEKCQEKLQQKYDEGYSKGLEETQQKLKDLQKKIEEKDQLIIDLQEQIDSQKENNEKKEEQINQLNVQLEQLQAQITKLNIKIEEKTEKVDEQSKKIEQYQKKQVDKPKETVNDTTKKKGSIWLSIGKKMLEYSSLLSILLGGGGVLAILKRHALMRIPKLLFGMFQSNDSGGSQQSNNEQVPVNSPDFDKLFTWLDKKFEDNNATTENIINNKINQFEEKNEATDYDEIFKWINEKFNEKDSQTDAKINAVGDIVKDKFNEFERKLKSDSQDQGHNYSVNINNPDQNTVDNNENKFGFNYKQKPNPQSLDRIKQFFELKSHDGEKIEQWAMYAILYREAMQLLRRGEFDILVVGNNVDLQGQRLAAEKIDDWVRDQYIKRTTIEKIQLDYIYHEAMLGFLYREAVDRLRHGEFSLLGAKETADAVEKWVKQEFLKRMGINL